MNGESPPGRPLAGSRGAADSGDRRFDDAPEEDAARRRSASGRGSR